MIRALAAVSTEAQGEQLVEDVVVVADGGGGVEVLQPHCRVQAGGAGAALRGGGFPAGDLVGQDELEELGVGQLAGARGPRPVKLPSL
jgi:hypothetical protein